MTAFTTIVIKHGPENPASVSDRLIRAASDKHGAINELQKQLSGLACGSLTGRVSIKVDSLTVGDRATATATCVSVVEDNTLTVGDVTLTMKDSPSGESEVDVGASDTIMATNIAASINAHTQLAGLVTATSAAGVVTITSALPGRIGEMITLVRVGAPITLSAAALGGITATSTAIIRDHGYGVA